MLKGLTLNETGSSLLIVSDHDRYADDALGRTLYRSVASSAACDPAQCPVVKAAVML